MAIHFRDSFFTILNTPNTIPVRAGITNRTKPMPLSNEAGSPENIDSNRVNNSRAIIENTNSPIDLVPCSDFI
jgi:hypothetical protein